MANTLVHITSVLLVSVNDFRPFELKVFISNLNFNSEKVFVTFQMHTYPLKLTTDDHKQKYILKSLSSSLGTQSEYD